MLYMYILNVPTQLPVKDIRYARVAESLRVSPFEANGGVNNMSETKRQKILNYRKA